MKRVVLKIDIKDKRGNLSVGDKGKTTSIIAHSDGLYPVWFEKHRKEFYWYPLFLSKENFDFI